MKIALIKNSKLIAILTALFFPAVVLAQTAAAPTDLTSLISTINGFLPSIVNILVGCGLIVFLYGVVRFIGSSSDEDRAEGKKFILYGIVALAVMLTVWSLVKILVVTFGINPVVPQITPNFQ